VTQAEQAIKEFIHDEFLRDKPQSELANDEPLIQAGIIDSLGIFLLIGFLEEQFRIKIEPQDVVLENFETVNAISSLVATRRNSSVPPAGH
jgi:acyl carrier protein